VPAGVITGPITVTTPANTASTGAALFYGPPAVSSFDPTHGLSGTAVTITGTNFLGASAVRFNGVNASSVTVVNNGSIQAAVPANTLTGPISVVGPAGTGSSANNFTVDLVSDLAISTTHVPDPVFWSSNLVYTVLVTNAGPFDAPNVVLSDPLPSALIYQSATATQGSISTNANVVTANLGKILNTGSAIVTVTITANALGWVTNVFSVSSDYPDPAPANNTNVITSLILPLPLLEIEPYSPGQWKISWPVMLTNYALEAKTFLNTNYPWTAIASQPFISGTNIFVIEVSADGAKFYRLKH
jgi:uncharacterized repeat protein (TIGR01451 family)